MCIDADGKTYAASYNLNPFGGGSGDTGNVYLVVARYNFSTREFAVKAYYRAQSVPEDEPGSWDAARTLPSGWMMKWMLSATR